MKLHGTFLKIKMVIWESSYFSIFKKEKLQNTEGEFEFDESFDVKEMHQVTKSKNKCFN